MTFPLRSGSSPLGLKGPHRAFPPGGARARHLRPMAAAQRGRAAQSALPCNTHLLPCAAQGPGMGQTLAQSTLLHATAEEGSTGEKKSSISPFSRSACGGDVRRWGSDGRRRHRPESHRLFGAKKRCCAVRPLRARRRSDAEIAAIVSSPRRGEPGSCGQQRPPTLPKKLNLPRPAHVGGGRLPRVDRSEMFRAFEGPSTEPRRTFGSSNRLPAICSQEPGGALDGMVGFEAPNWVSKPISIPRPPHERKRVWYVNVSRGPPADDAGTAAFAGELHALQSAVQRSYWRRREEESPVGFGDRRLPSTRKLDVVFMRKKIGARPANPSSAQERGVGRRQGRPEGCWGPSTRVRFRARMIAPARGTTSTETVGGEVVREDRGGGKSASYPSRRRGPAARSGASRTAILCDDGHFATGRF